MARKKNKHSVISDLVGFVINGSLLVVFGALLLLIYIPFSDSINAALKPEPKTINGNESSGSSDSMDDNRVVNGIHLATGMVYDKNFEIVKGACTSCHSAQLITQNRATRDGWKQMIRWMQATQGLPDLGKNESKILTYLAKNYAPEDVGRRKNLNPEEIEWYTLSLD